MRSLPLAAGVRIADERAVEEWVELAIDGMMQEPIAHTRLMDVARLRVRDIESVVTTVDISLIRKIVMKRKNVVRKPVLEFLYVLFVSLPFQEFMPCAEQIIY